jgi:hypothetical protein
MTVFVPGAVPPAMRAKVGSLLANAAAFAQLHQVQDKDSKKLIPFVPLPMQSKIFAAVGAGHKRIVILKARQVAATTGAKMVMHHLAYTSPNAAMHAIVSMREDSATALLDDNRRWLDHPPELLRRPTTSARSRLVYTDTGASLQAFTSRSQTGLRSFTPAAALISEAAYAPDLEEVLAQVDAAVGDGILIIESTAANPNDFFSNLVRGAPENGWHLITMFWHEHPAYCDPAALIPADFETSLTDTEKAQQTAYHLTLGQLHWRRRTLNRLGSEHKFRREYPGNIDDCFLDREGGFFEDNLLSQVNVVEHQLHGEHVGREIEKPHPHDRYVVGVDVGGGVGGDYSALAVVSVATMQPVYTERSNKLTPQQWAHRVIQVASRYNSALVLAESNNHGHALLLEMQNCGYNAQWRDPRTGKPWVTTLQSKLDAYATLREALQLVRIMDRPTWLELRSLTIPPGKIAPEAPKGGYDDAATALALAYRCARDIPPSWRTQANSSGRTRVDDLLAASRARRIRSAALPF